MANYQSQGKLSLKGNFKTTRIAIIYTNWNQDVVGLMLSESIKSLTEAGVARKNIVELMVPGSFEIPNMTRFLMQQKKYDAIITLGAIIKGETMHDVVLAHSVTDALCALSYEPKAVPIILGVLTTNNHKQAMARANGKSGNKGKDCAEAALQMISLQTKKA
jgi:6,7-dimethyl-8-ribityllumazine synthase